MKTLKDDFLSIIQPMIDEKRKHIERLLYLKSQGVEIGAPTLADIIDREMQAIDNLERSKAQFEAWLVSRRP